MPFITIRRARTWHYRKMRPCIEQSNGPMSLSLSQSCPDCIINTSGYDFRKGQDVSRLPALATDLVNNRGAGCRLNSGRGTWACSPAPVQARPVATTVGHEY